MAIENLKTREKYSDSDMDISSIDEHGLVSIEAVRRSIYIDQYTRVMINKEDAQQIINHLKEQFGL